jgi:hypothetical protein
MARWLFGLGAGSAAQGAAPGAATLATPCIDRLPPIFDGQNYHYQTAPLSTFDYRAIAS